MFRVVRVLVVVIALGLTLTPLSSQIAVGQATVVTFNSVLGVQSSGVGNFSIDAQNGALVTNTTGVGAQLDCIQSLNAFTETMTLTAIASVGVTFPGGGTAASNFVDAITTLNLGGTIVPFVTIGVPVTTIAAGQAANTFGTLCADVAFGGIPGLQTSAGTLALNLAGFSEGVFGVGNTVTFSVTKTIA